MAGRIHIAFSSERLNPAEAFAFVADPACGAVASFFGVVRENNLGRAVVAVSYDVFDELAEGRLSRICLETAEAIEPRMNLYVAHIKGRQPVGGLSVIIAASTPHRDEAFRACRRVIEEIKRGVPIWKQEHYADGDSAWIPGHALNPDESH